MALCRMKSQRRLASERGIALAVVLLILVVVLLLGTTLIGVSVTEDRAGSIRADMKKAFFAAETGIQEAMYRMRLDPASFPNSVEGNPVCSATADPVVIGQQGTPDPSWADPTNATFWKYNPPACSWTYASGGGGYGGGATYGNFWGGTAGNLDSAGRTFTSSTSSGSSHAVGGALVNASLTNTASDPRTYTVTVASVVGFVGGCWQYVDQSGAPLGSCASVATNPMFKVTSTGTARNAQKKLSTMIRRLNINSNPDAALAANTNIDVQSASAVIDGHNFDCNGNNPSNTDSLKAATAPTGAAGISIKKDNNLQCATGNDVNQCGGTSTAFPDSIGALLLRGSSPTQAQIDALNAYLESIKIDPVAHPEKLPNSAYHGVLYVGGDYAKPPDGSTGILIVHNSKNNANLGNFNGGTFKGLIIADSIKINGNAQIIGAIFAFGSTAAVAVNDIMGTPTIKYSKCVVDGLAKNFPFQIVKGTWHEEQLIQMY